jgi:hypothetical protein
MFICHFEGYMINLRPFFLFIVNAYILFTLSSCLNPELCAAQAADDTVTITGVGDIMMGSHFPSNDSLPPDDGKNLLASVKPYLENSDIVMGNLEGSFLNDGECVKVCDDPKNCYAFKMPEHYVTNLVNTRFNLLSIANNHIGDFGKPGRDRTMKILRNAGIHFAGTDSQPYDLFEINGVKYGFCAFAPNQGTPDLRDLDKAKKIVEQLDVMCDIVIVSFHGGAEGEDNRHVTRKTEIYNGEDRGNVYSFAHLMIDSGGDVIFGHGPHVTRAAELYKGRFIAYSLGNFCTYGHFNLKGHSGVAPIIRLTVKKNGEFVQGIIYPLIQKHKKGPVIDDKKRAISDIIELISTDFPDTGLEINKNGAISRIN